MQIPSLLSSYVLYLSQAAVHLDSLQSTVSSTEAASSWFPVAPAERPPLVHTHSAEVGAAELIGLLHSDDAQPQAVN